MLATISGFFLSKSIPWKWIGIGLAALAVVSAIAGGYLYVDHLTSSLAETRAELATETRKAAEADARANAIKAQHDVQIERINKLEDERSTIAQEVLGLRATIQDLDIEEDLASDEEDKANAALGRLNARNLELNRLLDTASGYQVHPGPATGSKAGKADAPSPIRRALEALR
jgi:septal ring factor EnvC (AmiA/AmiB activator)